MESVVKLHDIEYDEDIEYVIVGSSEADSLNNKISNESPLGAALIGKKVVFFSFTSSICFLISSILSADL